MKPELQQKITLEAVTKKDNRNQNKAHATEPPIGDINIVSTNIAQV